MFLVYVVSRVLSLSLHGRCILEKSEVTARSVIGEPSAGIAGPLCEVPGL